MKRFFLFFVFSAFLFQANAQLLWKVTGKGLKKPSYLFGTHHLISVDFLDSVPDLYKAFNASTGVVGEVVLNNVDVSAKIQEAAMLPGKLTMDSLIRDSSDYKLVDKKLRSVLNLPLKKVAKMNPTLILTLYEMELMKKTLKKTDDIQSDSYFQLVGAEKGKNIYALESVDDQIKALFGNGSLQRQTEVMVSTIKENNESVLAEMNQLNSMYKSGNLQQLERLSERKEKTYDMTAEEFDRLVSDRNIKWMKKLPALMASESCFIAVGALHLTGENGLIRLLQKSGYKVKPVK